MSDTLSLKIFKCISSFVQNLNEEYGTQHKPLRFFAKLVDRVKITNEVAIAKLTEIFRTFCISNREAFKTQEVAKLSSIKITYSETIFIDMSVIFLMADQENQSIIWRHLLTISALVDPENNARELLQKMSEVQPSKEDELIKNVISKVEQAVKPDSNPADAISAIMQSGIISEVMNGMSNNTLDIGKLLGSVQGMISTMGAENPEAKQITDSVSGAIGNGSSPPDLSGLFSMMTSLLGNSGNIPNIPKN